jgi:hypothetical protein
MDIVSLLMLKKDFLETEEHISIWRWKEYCYGNIVFGGKAINNVQTDYLCTKYYILKLLKNLCKHFFLSSDLSVINAYTRITMILCCES